MIERLADIITTSAGRHPDSAAIRCNKKTVSYEDLAGTVESFARGLMSLGVERHGRVAVFAGKQPETVVSMFGASRAGGVVVPVNPILRARQVGHILNDCGAEVLVTTETRCANLSSILGECSTLKHIILMDGNAAATSGADHRLVGWNSVLDEKARGVRARGICSDMAAILYTSGSTGMPKGVVLSHANITIGAESVAAYLENSPADRVLAVLPFSFDAGLSQLTTGLFSGACVVLHDYLLPRDVVRIVEEEQITGLTAVPPLWMQLADQDWPEGRTNSLRYFANTGGKMPRKTLARLRQIFPKAKPYLMYGLTEAFRSTYLPPSEVDRRPDSIGKAIPNVEVMVVGKDGKVCQTGEVGELVHRGPLVALGYWNDPERTARRFRPAPDQPDGIPTDELAVWSGDSVRMDDEGYLYFVGRMDDMIKTSGYRVSPTEVEEVAYDTGLVSEVVVLGIPHEQLGQGIVLVAKAKRHGDEPTDTLLQMIRPEIPNYMVPLTIRWTDSLPRNANGKLDRKQMADELTDLFRQENRA